MKPQDFKTYLLVLRIVNNLAPALLAKMRYKRLFGKKMNLKNPRDINEKIIWLALYSDTTEWSRLADKYEVRKYVEEKGLSEILIPLIGKWDSSEEINWNSLPDNCIIKTNNGSGTNIVIEDKSGIDTASISKQLDNWLKTKQSKYTADFHYRRIKPCIIAEKLLKNPEDVARYSSTLIDYKIWCFNGKAHYIWACSNRVGESTEVALFDREWNYLPELSIFTEHYKEQAFLVPKPECLDEMIKDAEILSSGFPEVRVDLYALGNKVYFGEMTFTSLGGIMDFYTLECLQKMGELIDISQVKKIK